MFLDDVLECFRIVSLGIPSASRLIGEDFLKQRFRASAGIRGCVAVCRYLLSAWIVKAVAGAGVKLKRDVTAKRPAALDKSPAEPGRGLLIGGAVEGQHRGVGSVALCVKMPA
jgi:hypothetical protein